jgi:hypothetical protein
MRKGAGRKENSHHRTGYRDTKQDAYGPQQPSPFQTQVAAPDVQVSAEEGEQKESIKEQNR